LKLKQFLKDGAQSLCNLGNRNFGKSFETSVINNRRETSKNGIVIENFFTGSNDTSVHSRKRSKEIVREKSK